jgi:hypothetical protein
MPAAIIDHSKPRREQLTHKQQTMLRYGISEREMSDQRISRLVDYKIALDAKVRELRNVPYSDHRLAAMCARIGLYKSDLAEKHIADLVKGTLDSELYLEVLRSRQKEQR